MIARIALALVALSALAMAGCATVTAGGDKLYDACTNRNITFPSCPSQG